MTPAEMKVAIAKIGDNAGDLIEEFESISKVLGAFSDMFDDAAARLTIVKAKLV